MPTVPNPMQSNFSVDIGDVNETKRFAEISTKQRELLAADLLEASTTVKHSLSTNATDSYDVPLDMQPDHQTISTVEKLANSISPDNFVYHKIIGTGTFGRVRMVKFRGSTTPLAMKIIDKSRVIEHAQTAHIRNEKHILEAIHTNPFVVKLYTTFQDSLRIYFLMDYVCGGELFSYLRNENRLTKRRARFYAAEVAEALAQLHDMEIAYRDLKPENILIDSHSINHSIMNE
eukprot:GHVU01193668.1.p1 GENE.GHVU01193668.1~~GHVU01193668.1.p1  ORF type:complete len:265 (-),score=49.85 GHVU01193668.1:67-762(-)